jgi:hypothetical protein
MNGTENPASELIDERIAGLDGNARRAIDIREGEEVDAEAFKALILAAAPAARAWCSAATRPGPSGRRGAPNRQ